MHQGCENVMKAINVSCGRNAYKILCTAVLHCKNRQTDILLVTNLLLILIASNFNLCRSGSKGSIHTDCYRFLLNLLHDPPIFNFTAL